jgi:RNA polymerase sigma factor (sigma-70 family)
MARNRTGEQVYQTDDELVEQIKAGEVALFAVLMKRHNQKLYRVARGMGVPNEECDDIIQQTYIQAYLKMPQFRGESAFTTWLTRIHINQSLMFLRKQRPSVSEDGALEGMEADALVSPTSEKPATPESEMIKRELRTVLEQAIEQLPDDHRVVYIMREVEEMSVKEIASALGITESNVKVRMHRARKLLQDQLRSYLEPSEIFEFGSSRCDTIVAQVLEAIEQTL